MSYCTKGRVNATWMEGTHEFRVADCVGDDVVIEKGDLATVMGPRVVCLARYRESVG